MQHPPTQRRRPAWRASLALLLVGLLVAPPAWSVSGGKVVAGDAPIVSQGDTTTIHAANGSIIEWQDFDIGVNETVRFIQPGDRRGPARARTGGGAVHGHEWQWSHGFWTIPGPAGRRGRGRWGEGTQKVRDNSGELARERRS